MSRRNRTAEPPAQKLQLVGIEDIVAIYADTFMVAVDDSGMATISFFQAILELTDSSLGTQTIKKKGAKCVGKIVLSPKGLEALSNALVKNCEETETPSESELAPAIAAEVK